ncbi:pyridoxal-dependent decarboxylase [Ferruginibacter sp.]
MGHSGVIICKDAKILQEALSISAAYLPSSIEAEPSFYTPEMSRRARGIETWAALYSLGQTGVAELIERCCTYAALFADNLKKAGFKMLNTVTLNQVLVLLVIVS